MTVAIYCNREERTRQERIVMECGPVGAGWGPCVV